jgi:chorismate--pyruvate lyase
MECEHRALGLGRRVNALVREVLLRCDDEPWVFARTVIPATTLRGRTRRLAFLGGRPLGGMLFADASMERSEVEVARIDAHLPLYARASGGAAIGEVIWGRRSVFWIAGRPLLVSELFLPVVHRRSPEERPWRR